MFSKKQKEAYDSETQLLKKRLANVESQLEYFKFKEISPKGIKVTTDTNVNMPSGYHSYWCGNMESGLDMLFSYNITVTWADPKTYEVHASEIIKCCGRPVKVHRYSIDDGVVTVAFSIHKIDGEYTVKWNTYSKTFKVFHNGVEMPFAPNTQDGKIIFQY